MKFENRICQGCGKEYRAILDSPQKYHSSQCSSKNRYRSKIRNDIKTELQKELNFKCNNFNEFIKLYDQLKEPRDNRTLPEKIFYEFLIFNNLKLNEDFIYQYKVFNYKVDFYLPAINLGIEIDGDYWHANPDRYKPDDLIKFPYGEVKAKDIWEKDKIRENKIKEIIPLKRFWENDLIKKQCENEISEILYKI